MCSGSVPIQLRGSGLWSWQLVICTRARCPSDGAESQLRPCQVIDGTMVKIYAWYDNEYGYSARLVDVAKMVAEAL